MNVCFVIDDFSAVGGIQRVVSLIANELTKNNRVYVLSLYQEHGDNNANLYNSEVVLNTLIQGKKKYVQQSLKAAKLLRDNIKKNEIEMLIGTSEMMSPYCFLATRFLNVPYICWTHTPAFNNDEAKIQGFFKWLGVNTSAYTVTLTNESKIQLIKKYKKNHVTVITNPIDPVLMKDINYNSNCKKIVTVGRICYQKYYEKLVEVAAIVLPKYNDWTWEVYGDGNDRTKIEELIDKNNLTGKLILKGDVSNMYELYKNYSFQVMTSRFEGFPMTLLEGIANGLPLIGFNIAGVNDIIKNEKNGYLVDAYNQNKMAAAIEKLIMDVNLRKKMSLFNKKNRDIYAIEKTANSWNKLFAEIRK